RGLAIGRRVLRQVALARAVGVGGVDLLVPVPGGREDDLTVRRLRGGRGAGNYECNEDNGGELAQHGKSFRFIGVGRAARLSSERSSSAGGARRDPSCERSARVPRMPEVETSRDGAVLTITLTRPEVLNALNAAMHAGLAAALKEAARDPELRAVVLTGAGRGFCVG